MPSEGTRYRERVDSGRRPASIEFPEDLYDALRKVAVVEERSIAAVTRIAVADYISRHHPQHATEFANAIRG